MGYVKRGLIPSLSSNTSNPDFIVKSNSVSGSNNVYKAFNGTNDSADDCYISTVNSGEESAYIQIDMTKSCLICGLNITSRNGSPTLDGDYKLYLSNDGVSWKETLSVSTQSTPNTDREVMFYPKKCKYIKLVALSKDVQLAIAKLQFYVIEEFYVIKQDGKYYSFNEEQYNQETKMFNEVTLEQINTTVNNNYLSEKGYLTQQYTIGDETFRPIDKFNDEFQLVSTENRDIFLNAVKSKQELIVANGDINANIADHIDFFKAEYGVYNDDDSIKIAVSTDKGSTWRTSKDNGITWEAVTCTKEEIAAHGLDIKDLENVDFNTLFEEGNSDRLIRLAYVITIGAVRKCVTTNLSWQFDAKGRYRQLGNDDVMIELSQEYITMTPKKDMDILKLAVGTGGNLTVNEITNNGVADEATEEEVLDMVKEVLDNE